MGDRIIDAIATHASSFSSGQSLELFKRICRSRAFERNARQAIDTKSIKCPTYLSFGQESISSALSMIFEQVNLFPQHRCHDIYLAFGGDPETLVDELLSRPTGCSGGMGGSASISFQTDKIKMFAHDGLMGTQIPIATGYALATEKLTIAFMGDASAEEGYVLGALGFATTKKAPALYIVADNNLSILTEVKVRRSWSMASHANFGMENIEMSDDPWTIMYEAQKLIKNLPALMNIHTCRHWWHAGSGQDGEPEWDRFELTKEIMIELGLEKESIDIEKTAQNEMDNLWQRKLKEGQ